MAGTGPIVYKKTLSCSTDREKGGGRERERRGLKEIVYHNELVRLHDKKDFYRTVKLKIKAALF